MTLSFVNISSANPLPVALIDFTMGTKGAFFKSVVGKFKVLLGSQEKIRAMTPIKMEEVIRMNQVFVEANHFYVSW